MPQLIFGCGYLGERVALRWRDNGAEVFVVTRSEERARRFVRQGYQAVVADVNQPETLRNLPAADAVLFAVGHDRKSSASITDVYAGGVRNVLAAVHGDAGRFIYISTTGVYGAASGEWVDEATPPDPQRDGGRASLAAEQVLAAHPVGARSIILRLAGIYGPGRVPFVKELRAGEPIAAPTTGYMNLIHVDDAAQVVLSAARIPPFTNGPRVYCVSDGHPVQRDEFYREVARQVGAPPPQFVNPDRNSPRAARAAANRRICNDRMLADLRTTLQYPDYRSGIESLVETQNQ